MRIASLPRSRSFFHLQHRRDIHNIKRMPATNTNTVAQKPMHGAKSCVHQYERSSREAGSSSVALTTPADALEEGSPKGGALSDDMK